MKIAPLVQDVPLNDFEGNADNSRPPDAAIRANAAIMQACMESTGRLMEAAGRGGLNIVINGSNAPRAPERISGFNGNELAAIGALGGVAAKSADAEKAPQEPEPKEIAPPPTDAPGPAADSEEPVKATSENDADTGPVAQKKQKKVKKEKEKEPAPVTPTSNDEAAPVDGQVSDSTPDPSLDVSAPPDDAVDVDGDGLPDASSGDQVSNDGVDPEIPAESDPVVDKAADDKPVELTDAEGTDAEGGFLAWLAGLFGASDAGGSIAEGVKADTVVA